MVRKRAAAWRQNDLIVQLDLHDCPPGPALDPLRPRTEVEQRFFAGWDTPLTPWGGFGLDSGLAVVHDADTGHPGARTVLEFHDQFRGSARERMLVAGTDEVRDARIEAEVRPLQAEYGPHHDRDDCHEAYVGIVFRMETVRRHYLFALEGLRRAVLYRRFDDEWAVLAEQPVILPDDYLRLDVHLDGDGIRCLCPALDVSLFVTDTVFASGKAGIRALGRARVGSVRLWQTGAQQARDRRRRVQAGIEARARGMDVPDAVLVHTLDLAELGGAPTFADVAEPGRYDIGLLTS